MQVISPARAPPVESPAPATTESPPRSPELAANLDRLDRQEREQADRAKAEALARLRELARFD